MIAAVRAWRDALRTVDPTAAMPFLSPEGARAGWSAAWEALDDASLAEAIAGEGAPYATATVVAAGAVPTAVIEWVAVLLARGTAVLVKHPAGEPGITGFLVDAARRHGLPLAATDDRRAIDAELVVAMGSDETIAAIGASLPASSRFLGHGHRFSIAWVTGDWPGLAEDLALYDGRGCLSPVIAFTPVGVDQAVPALASAMRTAQARWPVGTIDPVEGAAIRAREALARVVGRVERGDGWSICVLPADRVVPQALPRSVALVCGVDPSAAAAIVAPWGRWLSLLGTDDDAIAEAFVRAGVTRVAALGRMQRPPLIRTHDGEEWLRQVVRPVQ